MVRGVNKTVIEVNNTGSKLFEKIVFYVTPEYGSLSAKQLKKAARSFSFNFEDSGSSALRKRIKSNKRKKILIFSAAAVILLAVLLLILL